MNKSLKTILFILIVVIVAVSVIILVKRNNDRELIRSEVDCNEDADCVIVSKRDEQNPCCTRCGSEAINKDARDRRTSWWSGNCSDVQCLTYDCYEEQLPTPRCIGNRCTIEWTNRVTR